MFQPGKGDNTLLFFVFDFVCFLFIFVFCSGVLPGMIQFSIFAGLPSMIWGSGVLNIQRASHLLNLSHRDSNPRSCAHEPNALQINNAANQLLDPPSICTILNIFRNAIKYGNIRSFV